MIALLIGLFVFTIGKNSLSNTNTTVQEVQKKGSEKMTAFPRYGPGTVCVGQDNFSFRSDGPYSILDENKNGIAITPRGILLTVAKSGNDTAQTLEALLNKRPVSFTKDDGLLTYALDKDTLAISAVKDNFVISVFYKSPTSKEQAKKMVTVQLMQEETGNWVCTRDKTHVFTIDKEGYPRSKK